MATRAVAWRLDALWCSSGRSQIVSTAASNGAAAMDASCMVSVVVGEKDAESRGVRWTTRRRERCGDHAARPAAVAHRHVHGHRRRVPRPRQPRGACGDSMRGEKGQPSSTVHGMHKMDWVCGRSLVGLVDRVVRRLRQRWCILMVDAQNFMLTTFLWRGGGYEIPAFLPTRNKLEHHRYSYFLVRGYEISIFSIYEFRTKRWADSMATSPAIPHHRIGRWMAQIRRF